MRINDFFARTIGKKGDSVPLLFNALSFLCTTLLCKQKAMSRQSKIYTHCIALRIYQLQAVAVDLLELSC